MPDAPTPNTTPNRKPILWAAGLLALAALVAVGLIAARDNGPAQANLPDDVEAVQTTPAAGSAEEPAATKTPLAGKGQPIAVSGTDPVTGKPVDLASAKGKPVVLTIWASWCPGCNAEAPDLAKADAARDDVNFVGINYRDSPAGARGFYEKYGLSMPSIEDIDGTKAIKLGLQGTPTTLFLDKDLREIARVVGAMDETSLNDALDRITGA